MQLFDALVKKFSEMTMFQIADVYGAFEALEVSLDKARNDVSLDKVVRIGANRALFILGKYYSKLDDCEVYSIATSEFLWCCTVSIAYFFTFAVLTPTKTYCWFKKNSGWQEDWKQMPLNKLHHRWVTGYKPKPAPGAPAKVLPIFNSNTVPADASSNVIVLIYISRCGYELTSSISHTMLHLTTLHWIPTTTSILTN